MTAYKTTDCDSGRDCLAYDKRSRGKTEKDREPEADGKKKKQRNVAIKGRK